MAETQSDNIEAEPTRRDFIVLMASGMAAVGGAGALWPFVDLSLIHI